MDREEEGMYYTQQHRLKDNLWQYTAITVPQGHQPYYQLHTGGANQRFILSSPSHTRYWGVVDDDYYGVTLLHNPKHWTVAQMPIAPITSPDIEAFKIKVACNTTLAHKSTMSDTICDNAYYQYWATFFAKALMVSNQGVLYAGDWRIFPACYTYDKQTSPPTYEKLTKSFKQHFASSEEHDTHRKLYNPDHLYCWGFSLLDPEDYNDICPYIDWTRSCAYPLIYHHTPDSTDGRVKWWRKKVRDDTCPPILVWFQPHLQGHLLIDGHARLQAYLLEGKPPKVLTLVNIQHDTHIKGEQEKTRDQHILSSVADNLAHSDTPIKVERLNELLIQAYTPYQEYRRAILIAKPTATLDQQWLNDVKRIAEQYSLSEADLAYLLQNNGNIHRQ